MFDTLTQAPVDKILSLLAAFREDKRETKLDLGVGVYKDESGATTILRAIRHAEQRLFEGQTTKTYLSPAGDPGFNVAMTRLMFGDTPIEADRLFAAQATGGSGALRIIAELLKRAKPGATVHVSDPTWANHMPLIGAAGLATATYPYFDAASGTVRFEAMLDAFNAIPEGDIVLLHACCHNPTGANLTLDQWKSLATVIANRNLFPFVDMAYQGFGDGLDEDAAGLRHLATQVPELAIAASCSKNFAVYRDRVGAVILMGKTAAETKIAGSQVLNVIRGLVSMPPDHGAAAVRIVLEDEELRALWKSELDVMRNRMLRLRAEFADALRRQSNSDRFDFVAHHRGMFSRLGLTTAQVDRLREESGIYMIGDSRINVAGLPENGMDELAKAIVGVL